MPPGRAEGGDKGLCIEDFRSPAYLTSPTTLKKLRMDAELEALMARQVVASTAGTRKSAKSAHEEVGWLSRARQNRYPAQLLPQRVKEPKEAVGDYDPNRLVTIVRQGLRSTGGMDWRHYVRGEASEVPVTSWDGVSVTNRLICCRLIEESWEMPDVDDGASTTNRDATALTRREGSVLQKTTIEDGGKKSAATETALPSSVNSSRSTGLWSPVHDLYDPSSEEINSEKLNRPVRVSSRVNRLLMSDTH
nr:unnamed protein product [Spirometra erinaceieuropaei]